MTRETKVGLVVTASFLSLIGGVFAVKYLQGRTDSAVKSAEEKQLAEAGASAGDQIPSPRTTKSSEPPGMLPAVPIDPMKLDSPPLPSPAKNHDGLSATHDDPNKDDVFPSPIKQTGHAEDQTTSPPPPPVGPTITLPAPTTSAPTTSSPPPLELPKPGDPAPPLPGVGKLESPMSPMKSGGAPIPLPSSSAPTLSPPEIGSKPATPPAPSPSPELVPLPGATIPDKSKDPPKPPKTADNPNEIKLLPMTPTIDPPPSIPMPKTGDKPTIDLPKPGDSGPKPTLDLPKPGDSGPKPTIDLPKPGDTGTKPMLDLPKPGDSGLKPSTDLPKPNGSGPKPPGDFPRSTGPTPPPDLNNNVGGARLDPAGARPLENQPEPPVNSYDEEWHYCKQQGESLEAISQKYYFTPKYAQALRQYNIDRNPAPVFQQEKPSLSVGQVVKVPPARILERRYPSTVGDARAAAPVRPTAATPGNTTPTASLGPAAAQDLGGPHEYTVPHDGMTLKDVARDELGNESQWHRIFLLNRWVNPSAPLPTGAKLFLPRAGSQ